MFSNKQNTTRRKVIASITTATTIAVAGCSSGSGGSPKATTRQFYSAINDGNYDEVVSLLSDNLADETTKTEVAEESSRNPQVEEVVIVEETDTEATVNAVIRVESALGEITTTQKLQMEKQNGNWVINEITSTDQ